ncbi:uncharacterized protein E5676_scaffold387G00080 [Cucumis melo var. makuwa]|uniref:Uncharacterized protein n=1 Tax=Cucumis melo var. makuwa TaxID=1194695 RepID=A0A5D3DGN9_CUCMM|nr:uncharacterized protein E6C27_scaffold4427G00070 [Cucumis melo var. makuwa]TYK22510.1 uncharacterized protein E5676_scaffold387G00080 [Cucumis melo var. makuwa]
MYVISNSEAIYKPMIKAWYSATLFEHNSPSVKLYGNICFSGEMKTMLTPAPLLRVAPSKNMIQGSMLSTNNTSSSGALKIGGLSKYFLCYQMHFGTTDPNQRLHPSSSISRMVDIDLQD